MRLVLASRKSDLAKIQAYLVREALGSAHPSLKIEHHFRESLGDVNLNDPLWKMPERGVFTEDFAKGLLNGEFDAVVHSWKDLPVDGRPETEIIATLPRADVRDILLLRPEALTKKSWQILSSSPRREQNLKAFFDEYLPVKLDEVKFHNVRGNIPRRMGKLMEGEGDGLVLAKAALDRLLGGHWDEFAETRKTLKSYLEKLWVFVLPIEINPPAPAQGAIAIEIRKDRADLKSLFQRINHQQTMQDVIREREFLKGFGGGCHLAIGAHAKTDENGQRFVARGVTPEGRRFEENSFVGAKRGLRPEAVKAEELVSLDHADIFEAETLPLKEADIQALSQQNLFIAHSHALTPSVLKALEAQSQATPWVWTPGLESWRKLASRGIWVRGCFERQGGRVPEVKHLEAPRREWLKLTHEDAEYEGCLGVYRNLRKNDLKDVMTRLKQGRYFYWKSPSLLKEALSLVPEIKEREHACGFGQSRGKIESLLGRKIDSLLFLNEAEWRAYYS